MWYLSCVLEHCTFVVNACALPEPLISRSSAIYLEVILSSFWLVLVFTHVMRRPCWCTKQWQMSLKFCIIIESSSQKTISAIVLYTNMAAVTSGANQELAQMHLDLAFAAANGIRGDRTAVFRYKLCYHI